ncbi:hypothetical protein CYMTET_35433 [Cymbomonas tetramitiformis]|uniref:Uncharacterized protein n=1 Tax=Cymbomonas tetramitiformis TaxID=36881 RepID=A0AAE0F962_9CHLO|nr:hypothetical protein CYMTET_35433 [Cymbomonas tetramitiformis]
MPHGNATAGRQAGRSFRVEEGRRRLALEPAYQKDSSPLARCPHPAPNNTSKFESHWLTPPGTKRQPTIQMVPDVLTRHRATRQNRCRTDCAHFSVRPSWFAAPQKALIIWILVTRLDSVLCCISGEDLCKEGEDLCKEGEDLCKEGEAEPGSPELLWDPENRTRPLASDSRLKSFRSKKQKWLIDSSPSLSLTKEFPLYSLVHAFLGW